VSREPEYRIYAHGTWKLDWWTSWDIATQRIREAGLEVASEPGGYRTPDAIVDSFSQPDYDCYQWWAISDDTEQIGVLALILTEKQVPLAVRQEQARIRREAAKATLAEIGGREAEALP
jgi:hypothetical protein